MSEDRESFIDVLEDYFEFKKECSKGIDGIYFGWLCGHIESNEKYECDFIALRERFDRAIQPKVNQQSIPRLETLAGEFVT